MSGRPATTTNLRELQRRIPLVGERALVELVSDAGAVESANDARRRDGFMRRCVSALSGRDRREQTEITGKLAASQRTTVAWLRELAHQSEVTDRAVLQMAVHLRGVQSEMAHTSHVAHQALAEVHELAEVVATLAVRVEERLGEHDRRLDEHADRILALEGRLVRTEMWQSAWSGFDRSVRRWETRGAYAMLPWPYQVALVAREVAGGPCGVHEFVTHDESWRERLVDRILAEGRATRAWSGTKTLDSILDASWPALETTDHRLLVAELLGSGLPPELSTRDGNLSAAMRLVMEYASRPTETRPEDLATVAVDKTLHRGGDLLPLSFSVSGFVRRLVAEQATAARQALFEAQHARDRVAHRDEPTP